MRQHLEDPEVNAAWEEGKQLTLEEALAEARALAVPS